MIGLVQSRGWKITSLALGTFSLSACAISTAPALTSTQISAQISGQKLASVELLSAPQEAGLRAQFSGELENALGARGVTLQEGAGTIADFSVSERTSQVGLQAIPEGNEAAETQSGPIKPSIKPRWYHKCKPNKISASLVLYSRDSGAAIAKSSGDFLACPGDLSQLGDLASLLVDSAIAP